MVADDYEGPTRKALPPNSCFNRNLRDIIPFGEVNRNVKSRDAEKYSIQSSPFLNEVRKTMRLLHMSRKTEASYWHHIVDFIRFHVKRHPAELGAAEISGYLSHLAVDKSVSASTQNVALDSLVA